MMQILELYDKNFKALILKSASVNNAYMLERWKKHKTSANK